MSAYENVNEYGADMNVIVVFRLLEASHTLIASIHAKRMDYHSMRATEKHEMIAVEYLYTNTKYA